MRNGLTKSCLETYNTVQSCMCNYLSTFIYTYLPKPMRFILL